VGITGVAPVAYRARATEKVLTGAALDEKVVAAAAEKAADGIDPNEDIFASADYRRHLAGVFTKRALQAAVKRVT
jgi:carbon-monoxide dehydrogenase medium subunit